MDSGLNEYLGFLREGIVAPGEFRAEPFYKADADALFFYARDVQSYAKRLNSTLTLFLSTDGDEVVGFRIKGVTRILKTMHSLGIDKVVINEKGIRLSMFVKLAQIAPPDDPEMERFEDALNQYEDIMVSDRALEPN